MKSDLQQLFQLAARFFLKKYKKEGRVQSELAKELGITQSYLSSVTSGSRTASLELYNQIAEKLYGPLDKFLAVGRNIKEGRPPLEDKIKPREDSVENLIARLTYYVVDHQRIEKELSELKNFYETIVEKQQTGILVMDKNHTIVYGNERLNSMTNVSVEDVIGTSIFQVEDKINGLDISPFKEKYNKAFEKLESVSFDNIEIKLPDGVAVFISGALYPRQKRNRFDGMICSISETTTSHILRNLMINTLNFSEHGIGIVQQIHPGEQPQVYFKNRQFSEIFGLQDIDPSEVPFPEVLKLMASRMKNSKKWLDHVKKSISTNNVDSPFTITMKNNSKYEWISNPLIDDNAVHWGRIVTVKEIPQTGKKKK